MADKRKTKRRKDELEDPSSVETKPTKDEYAVAKFLKANVPTKKTKFLNHHVEYFTGSKAIDALLESKFATGTNPLFTTRHEVCDYLHQMLLHKFFHRAKKVPVSEAELKGKRKKEKETDKSKSGDEKDGEKSQTSACEGKEKDSKDTEKSTERKKRKIRLEMHMCQQFVDGWEAYVWLYAPPPLLYWLCGALLLLGAGALCLFPLWPHTVRKGVYYLSVAAAGFLVAVIALAVLRVVVFCAVWLLTLSRHHIWLLPNLTEDVGFLQSFWPLYKYEYRGPDAESQKSSKSKKKRKKEKQSDDENDERKPLVVNNDDPPPTTEVVQHKETEEAASPNAVDDKVSESESENSQRSSTDRDFEMVESADFEQEPETHTTT